VTPESRIATELLDQLLKHLAKGERPVRLVEDLAEARKRAGWKEHMSHGFPGFVHEPCATWVWWHAPMECTCTNVSTHK
jgi:hypothetical protein